MSEHIPVFCATDENYAPFASIMMKSILMHTNSFVDFYILDGGIKEKTKKLILKDLKKYPNKELHFVDMRKYALSELPSLHYWSSSMYSRFFIPQIVPNLKRAIYLDVDIIVRKDIATLYRQDLENYPIGAMEETKHISIYSKRRLQKSCPSFKGMYFNSGVLLLDIPKLIQMDFVNKAVKLTTDMKDLVSFPDQDILNIFFENNIKGLDYSFDLFTDMVHELKHNYPQQSLDPVIIHYTCFKPWKEYTAFGKDFEDVLKDSVFYKRVVQEYRLQKKSKWLLFGFIPLFKTSKKNHAFDEKDTL